MMNLSRMQLNWIIFESRLEGLNRHTFQTNGDFERELVMNIQPANQH